MSSDPIPGGAIAGSVAPARGANPTAQRDAAPWPPTLPAPSTAAAIGFSSASNRLDGGQHAGEDRSPPGELAVVMAALMIGLLLMGTQLWLLTVALELHLSGQGQHVWLLALVSGAIFAGGVAMLRLLGRRTRMGR